MRTLYIQVSKDKYELPIAVADSPQELGRMIGKTAKNVSSMASKYEKGVGWYSVRRVVIEEEDDE